jgi:hypothetical protein
MAPGLDSRFRQKEDDRWPGRRGDCLVRLGLKLPAAARRGRWQRATFGEDLHVLERPRERCRLLRPILFTGGVIR